MSLSAKMKSWSVAPLALVVLFLISCEPPAAAGSEESDGTLARVGDIEITEADLRAQMAAAFLKIDRERHQLLEQGMERAIADALLEAEAEKKDLSVEQLMEEVYADTPGPTDEEVDAFYEQNKARIRGSKEETVVQIRAYLAQQGRQKIYDDYIGELSGRYEVSRYLEPMRTPVEAEGPASGPADAAVTIVEFSDFQCPYCKRLAPTLDQIRDSYGDKVRVVFRQFPIPELHQDAQKAAEASLCAAEQGKFWEMHDSMFADIQGLSVEQLKQKAAGLDLDATAFGECLDSGRLADAVARDTQAGRALGVTGTPAMFINGRFVSGAATFEQIAALVDDELERDTKQ